MKKDKMEKKLSCADQLRKLRDFYDTLAIDICQQLHISRRMYNYKILHDSFSVAENNMIANIITTKTKDLCA